MLLSVAFAAEVALLDSSPASASSSNVVRSSSLADASPTLVAFDVDVVFVLDVDVALSPDVALSAVPVALLVDVPPSSCKQPADDVSSAAVDVSFSEAAATSVLSITVIVMVGVTPVLLRSAATAVASPTVSVPRSQMTKPLNMSAMLAAAVLVSLAFAPKSSLVSLRDESSEVALLASPLSSVVVMLSSACCAYIETPAKAVDATTRADKSDSSVNFVLRSLNKPTQTVCQQKGFNEL
jgi:hypothetical protein